MKMKNKLYIIGAESTALEIKHIAETLNYETIFLVDKNKNNDKNILSELELKSYLDSNSDLIFGITNYKIKEGILGYIKNLKFNKVNIISQKSVLINNVKIGSGNYIAPHSILSNNAQIGDDCIINFNSVIGHDVKIGNNVVINPGAIIGGNVNIGNNCMIGANSFIHQGLQIGNYVKIDAMTHIFNDIEDKMICTNRSLKIFKNKF